MSDRAIVLIAHGSPDPDWAAPLHAVVAAMRDTEPNTMVALALLTEPDSLGLALEAMKAAGHTRVELVSALLSGGGRHLKRDIPAWVEDEQEKHPELTLELRPGAIGADPSVIGVLAQIALGSRSR